MSGPAHAPFFTARMIWSITSPSRVVRMPRFVRLSPRQKPLLALRFPVQRWSVSRLYPYSKQGWDRKWRRALAEAGIEGFRFHDTRHTALTRLGSIEAAQRLANHSDIRTTRRYFHTSEDEVRKLMAAAESRNSPEPVQEGSAETRRKAGESGL